MDPDAEEFYDALIYSVGYEARSRHVAEVLRLRCQRLVALGFLSHHTLSFDVNARWAKKYAHWFECLPAQEIVGTVEEQILKAVETAEGRVRIAVDVSSFSRDRLGSVILATLAVAADQPEAVVHFLYAPARFSRSPAADVGEIGVADLIDGFVGWAFDPAQATVAIVGLGYEPGRALGAIELLEPGRLALYLPRGIDGRFDRASETANAGLLGPVSRDVREYRVLRPRTLYGELAEIASGLPDLRPVFVPFGPKVFACCAMLVSALAEEAVPVWRISGGELEPPRQRSAVGEIAGLEVAFLAI